MIPKDLTLDDIKQAIKEIKKKNEKSILKGKGVPKGRGSMKYLLKHGKYYYPPKYTVSLANKLKKNEFLKPSNFGGGAEVNSFLRKLGFKIIEVSQLEPLKQLTLIKQNRIKANAVILNKYYTIKNPKPIFSRVVIARQWDSKPQAAKQILMELTEKWACDSKVKFILTFGGFVEFEWPKNLRDEEIGKPKEPKEYAIKLLVNAAQKVVEEILDPVLMKKLRQRADYITIGIDSFKNKEISLKNKNPHIELVALVDLRKGKYHWTGKSYPTSKQQGKLIRISNLESHFVHLEGLGNIMILGCHDLNIYHPRIITEKRELSKWRKDLNSSFRSLAKRNKPKFVLHHPHVTIQPSTWTHAWNKLKTEKELNFKDLENFYASAIRYDDPASNPNKFDFLDELLEKTKKGKSYDFIVY